MKKLILIAGITLFSLTLIYGQDTRGNREYRTVFNNRSMGAYGGITLGYTMIDGRDALLSGGRAELVMGHGFGIGVGGYGFINDPFYDPAAGLYFTHAGGYGGLVIEPIILWHMPVHVSLPVLLGAGGIALTSFSENLYDPYQYFDGYLEDVSLFLVAEPGAELEFNILRFFRVALYGSYRFTTAILLDNSNANALQGLSYGITFKFGKF